MKKLFLFIFVLFFIFILQSCGQKDYEGQDGEFDDDDIILLDTAPERKIIYNIETSLYTNDLEETVSYIEGLLLEDEWFDQENLYSRSAFYVIRVKTERLDAFINLIKDEYKLTDYSKKATDISLNYQSTTNKITAFNEERARLVELYPSATLSDMIVINTRIAEIDLELGELQGTLNEFDSLVDYSRVELSIHASYASTELPFGSRLIDGFVNGFLALVQFFDGLLVAIVTIIPWAVVLVPSGYGIYILVHRRNLKQLKIREEKKANKEIK